MEERRSDNRTADRIERITAVLFYLGLSIEIAAVVIDKSSVTNPVQTWMFRAAFLLFGLRCLACLRDYSGRERLLIAAALIVALICRQTSGRDELIRFLAFVCALRTMDVRKAAKFTFYATLAGCLVLIVLAAAGVLGQIALTADYGDGEETRLVLGLGHPNSLHCMALMLMLLGLYLYERQMRLYIYVVLLVGNLLLFMMTDSSMSFLIGTGALLLSALLHYCRRLRDGSWIYIAGEVLLSAGLVFSVFAATHDPRLDMSLMSFDAKYFSGRIYSLWQTVYHEGTLATWKWFGSRFNTYYFDLGWVKLVYWYGLAAAVMCIALTFALLEHARRKKDAAGYVMLIAMALYTVMEAHLVSEFIGRNYALFIAALYLPQMLRGRGREESIQKQSAGEADGA